ncbi:pre-mRNA-splicing factor SPF27 [Neocloeon triangulifer]|uniref:pre-mRNA-splicing factor SPF27 n=1 Tax=Neocloeon triangulifer TaxID=2078957 RepID=UPI00286EE2B4|nr:pre-mRNA-splicing factor SPF27 [Neocloeon triangulifer]
MATTEVLVDALPYIDQGYDEPGIREAALAMVEEENKRYRPTKNYLEHLPQLNLSSFETDIMKKEYERLSQKQPMDLLSMKRYELPPPPAGKLTDISAWSECVDNSMAQLEHQATRICNLELMLEHSCESWKSYLEVLIQLVLSAQKQLQALRKSIQEVNWQRKNEQLQAGDNLKALETKWVGLVSKNYEIEQACALLENTLRAEGVILEVP